MNTRKGFTLVELLVVIAILAILATVSVVGYTAFIENAKDSNAATEMNTVKRQIDSEAMTLGYEFGEYVLHLDGSTGYSVTKKSDGTAVTIDNDVVTALAAAIEADSDFGIIGDWSAGTGTVITFTSAGTNSGKAEWKIK